MISAKEGNGDLVDVVLDPSHKLYNIPRISGTIPDIKPAHDGDVYISSKVNIVEYGCGCIVFVYQNTQPPKCPKGHPARF